MHIQRYLVFTGSGTTALIIAKASSFNKRSWTQMTIGQQSCLLTKRIIIKMHQGSVCIRNLPIWQLTILLVIGMDVSIAKKTLIAAV